MNMLGKLLYGATDWSLGEEEHRSPLPHRLPSDDKIFLKHYAGEAATTCCCISFPDVNWNE